MALFDLGEARKQDNAPTEARDAFEKAIEVGQSFVDDNPANAAARRQIALGLFELSQVSEPSEAKSALRRAFDILDGLARQLPDNAMIANDRKALRGLLDKTLIGR